MKKFKVNRSKREIFFFLNIRFPDVSEHILASFIRTHMHTHTHNEHVHTAYQSMLRGAHSYTHTHTHTHTLTLSHTHAQAHTHTEKCSFEAPKDSQRKTFLSA